MNTCGIRNALVFLCALMLTTFAAPGIAAKPGKLYDLQFLLPDTVDGQPNPTYIDGQLDVDTSPPVVTVRLINLAPPSVGASNISSFQFRVSGLIVFDESADPPGVECPNALCSVDTSTNTVTVTNISPPVQPGSYDVRLRVKSCVVVNDATLPLGDVQVWTGSQVGNGSPFSPKAGLEDPTLSDADGPVGIKCGDIACAESFTVGNRACVGTDASKCVTTVRGFDADGGACSATSYFVTNNLAVSDDLVLFNPKRLHFAWPIADEPNAAPNATFAYQVHIPSGVGNPPSLQVSWLPEQGDPVFIPAPPCTVQVGALATAQDLVDLSLLSPSQSVLPSPYGELAQKAKASDGKIQVALSPGVAPPAVGSYIVIGSERMRVTGVSKNGSNWDVERGDAETDPAPHPAGSFVMSTALPKLGALTPDQTAAGYVTGNKAKMCQASDFDDTDGDGTWTGWVLDSGDGWMNW
jgi:hypothetical protein